MLDPKPWYQSRGILGAIVALLAGLAGLAGVVIGEEEKDTLAELLLALGSVIGGLVAWYGRVKATRPIGPSPDPYERGRIYLSVFPLLAILALAGGLLAGCAGMGHKPERPKTIPEQIEAASLFAGKVSDSITLLTCEKFDAGVCTEPGKPLNPLDALDYHAKVEQAHEALAAVALFGAGQTGECLGKQRTQAACLAAISALLLEVDRYLILKKGKVPQ